MSKAKLCGATTKRGSRCRNPAKAESDGLCYTHSRGGLPTKVPAEVKPTSSRFERVEKVAKFGGTLIGGIAGLIKIAEFVHAQWPHLDYLFQIHSGRNVTQLGESIKDFNVGKISASVFAYEADGWFGRLPPDVRREIENHFGDVKAIIVSVRASLD